MWRIFFGVVSSFLQLLFIAPPRGLQIHSGSMLQGNPMFHCLYCTSRFLFRFMLFFVSVVYRVKMLLLIHITLILKLCLFISFNINIIIRYFIIHFIIMPSLKIHNIRRILLQRNNAIYSLYFLYKSTQIDKHKGHTSYTPTEKTNNTHNNNNNNKL